MTVEMNINRKFKVKLFKKPKFLNPQSGITF